LKTSNSLASLVILSVLPLFGCSPSSIEMPPDHIQQRVEMYVLVSEMHDRETVLAGHIKDLFECANSLPQTFTDAEEAKKILGKLRKAKKDKKQIELLTRQLSTLIPLPEKYSKWKIKESSEPADEGIDKG